MIVLKDTIVCIKGHENVAMKLASCDENVCIETLDAVYEDVESLTNPDITNTMRCEQHVKNYALQNVLKIYNWWLQKNFLIKIC